MPNEILFLVNVGEVRAYKKIVIWRILGHSCQKDVNIYIRYMKWSHHVINVSLFLPKVNFSDLLLLAYVLERLILKSGISSKSFVA